jgi:4-alpha-glucanotransferase
MPGLFQFTRDREPKAVAGCPPDAFSITGQLWGNPVYNWKAHKKEGYSWWISRMSHAMKLYDVVRIDHFRGFEAYYSIPYGDETAENGKWVKGPGLELFEVLKENVEGLDVIAEDLGTLTDSVLVMQKASGFPGMKVLQFAFDDTENSTYLPYKYDTTNSVVYTGTHDNETTLGWLKNLNDHDMKFVREYINCYEGTLDDCVWGLIRAAMSSVAELCIIPIQDYLCLGNEARMNAPSTFGNNWKWRLTKGQIPEITLYTMRELTRIYGRLPEVKPEPEETKKDPEESQEKSEEKEAPAEAAS